MPTADGEVNLALTAENNIMGISIKAAASEAL